MIGFADGVIHAVPADQPAEVFQGEPGRVHPLFDGELLERFQEERLARPDRYRRPGLGVVVFVQFMSLLRLMRRSWCVARRRCWFRVG